MKITSFNPLIVTAHPEDLIKFFEELGFERRHTKEGIGINGIDNSVFRLKNANGFSLDIVHNGTLPSDLTGIRINVDDFDEAYKLFKAQGFEEYVNDGTINTASSKFVLLKSPSGFIINLIQHIK